MIRPFALSRARGDRPARGRPAQPEPTPPKVIALRPTASPVPALKYRLLPERRELIAGNAAVFYHRAIEMAQEVRIEQLTQAVATKQSPANLAKSGETIFQWISGPLRAIPREEARKQLDLYRNALREVELGARRESCDWEFDRRDEGYDLLLSDIQESRTLARLVALRVRFAILEGRTDEAIRWLQTGFALSRHVCRGTTLIQSLVGAAMASQMIDALEELIRAPGGPNLTWALASLPRPFIDLTPALDGGTRHARAGDAPPEGARLRAVGPRSGPVVRRGDAARPGEAHRDVGPRRGGLRPRDGGLGIAARLHGAGRPELSRGQACPDRPGAPRLAGRGDARHPGRRAPLVPEI